MNCTTRVAKIKALISFAATAKLVCPFVFAYAYCWFSDAVAPMYFTCNGDLALYDVYVTLDLKLHTNLDGSELQSLKYECVDSIAHVQMHRITKVA